VNAYGVEAGMVLFAGKTVWSVPEVVTIKALYQSAYLYIFLSFEKIEKVQYKITKNRMSRQTWTLSRL